MQIRIWGARGSLPTPFTPAALAAHFEGLFHEFFEKGNTKRDQIATFLKSLPLSHVGGFGGNTPCVEVLSKQSQVIIDGGSGIRLLGYDMMSGPCEKGMGEVHIFFTHFHWDHLVGLPFFNPMFIRGNRIHVYAVQPELEEVFQTVFRKPYFPVPLAKLGAKIEYHRLEPRKPMKVGDITITPYQLDHPDPCWGYKIENEGKVFSHCVDTEALRVSPEELGPDLPLYQGVDLMIFDAQYTLMETLEKVNWGHAAATLGIDIALREKIKRVLFMHHDPASSVAKIQEAEDQARHYFKNQLKDAKRTGVELAPLDWAFAHEGMVIDL